MNEDQKPSETSAPIGALESERVTPNGGPLDSYLSIRTGLLARGPGLIPPGTIGSLLTDALDQGLQTLAADAVAVVAVGGYGRKELCLFSDIDLLLLHEDRVPDGAVRAMLYPLWDAGLKIGHATRTVKATLSFARDDLQTLCGLLSARLVAGPVELMDQLMGGLTRLLSGARLLLPERLAAEERAVWEREPFALQELDLKNGRGGLRSLHRLMWDRRRAELLGEEPFLPVQPLEDAALRTLLTTRQALHAVERRAADVYAIELRTRVGTWLDQDPIDLATEVYRAARIVDASAAQRWGKVRQAGIDPIAHAGLSVVRFVRSRWSRGATIATPLAFARAAAASDAAGRLSPWERDFAARSGPPDWTAGDRSGLVDLLAAGRSGWEGLLGLWEAGWLSRALPEIAHLRGLAQVAPFHLHPADAHLGATVGNLVELAEGSPAWCGEIAEELGSLDEVLLAGFLHDVGKGLGGNHSEVGARLAESMLQRLGFGSASVDLVGRAVEHHLLLPETAFRRDIDDPAVVAAVASTIGNRDLLWVLTLLGVADAQATGTDMWSSWKESLLRKLVDKVAALLEGTRSELPAEMLLALALLAPERSQEMISSHLETMPPGYLARFGPEMVSQHLRLIDPPPQPGEMKTAILAGAPVSTLVTATRDRPGLLATIAGVLSLHNLAVLEARVVTSTDGIALDTFRVQDALGSDMVGPGRWPAVRETLGKAMTGDLDLAQRLADKRAVYPAGAGVTPPTIRVFSRRNGLTVDIRAHDRIGLLHDLAAALARLNLEVELAKIDTRGNEAVDVFEVRDRSSIPAEEIRLALLTAAS